MVTNTRLVIGTVETLCCVAAEAWAGSAEPRTRRPLRTYGVHVAVAGTAQARDPAQHCPRHPHSQAVAEATAAPEAPSPPSPGAHGPHVPSAGQLEAALGPPLHAAALLAGPQSERDAEWSVVPNTSTYHSRPHLPSEFLFSSRCHV